MFINLMKQVLIFYPKIVFRAPLQFVGGESEIDFSKKNIYSEALFLASSLLFQEQFKVKKSLKDEQKIKESLFKYRRRICNRCTPYGLFAGVGVVEWKDESLIKLSGKIKRSTRLDMNLTCAISDYVSNEKSLIKFIKFYPNSSIYKILNQIRYNEYILKDNIRVYHLASVESNEYLEKILDFSKNGVYFEKLVLNITDRKITKEIAAEYIRELIQAQILVSEIEPTTTGTEEYLLHLNSQLRQINKSAKSSFLNSLIFNLTDIIGLLNEIDHFSSNNFNLYDILKTKLNSLNIPFNKKDLFQTDMTFIDCQGGLSIGIQKKIINTINSLTKLFPDVKNVHIEKFKETFSERYEERYVPLLEVLDSDIGIGYPVQVAAGYNPLIDDLYFTSKNQDVNITVSKVDKFLLEKLHSALRENSNKISITSKEIDELNCLGSQYPDSLSVSFNFISKSNEKIFFKGARSNSTSMIGRFGFINDDIKQILFDIAADEEKNNEGKILAEIVHLPQSRTGNVLYRPAFRKFEIPFLGRSILPKAQQIELKDLALGVRNNKIILWSNKRNKEVVPKLGNAHNFSNNSLPVYQLLCDLQNQNSICNIFFHWGALASGLKYYPRVEIDGIVVFLETWYLNCSNILPIFNSTNSIDSIRKLLGLPEKVLFCENDNELLFDLTNQENIDVFRSIVKSNKTITIKEYLFDEKNSLIKDEYGRNFANECISFLTPSNSSNKTESKKKNIHFKNVQRKYITGSEWIYYKIYVGPRTSDILLNDYLFPFVTKLVKNNLIEKWFYIRYSDPDSHLRLRLKLKETVYLETIITQMKIFMQPLIDCDVVSKLLLDTYSRELERYGFNNIDDTEELFSIDSEVTALFLKDNRGYNKESIRWYWAIASVDQMLTDFGYGIPEKWSFFQIVKNSVCSEENNFNKELKTQIDTKYRKNRNQIDSILGSDKKYFKENVAMYSLLRYRTEKSAKVVPSIKKKCEDEEIILNEILMSYIHMSLNRIFVTNIQTNEIIIYNFLIRYYDSIFARTSKIN